MKKEIGGYFELEEMAGEEYYPNLYKVNLGRTALLWLLETRQYKKIYLPVFLCRSVIDICVEHDIEVEFYHLDADLNHFYNINEYERFKMRGINYINNSRRGKSF